MQPTELENDLPARLKAHFRHELKVPIATEQNLARALDATTERTGNFIRAQLAYAVARSQGSTDADALDLAIALEYFHTASLIFDDLPSMDDATHRRGAECIHLLFGEGTAILAALALINRAYGMLWRVVGAVPEAARFEALQYVERYLGLGGLLNGQSRDIHYARETRERRSPHLVAKGKTVGLIRLALVLPAIIHSADREAIRLLNHLAVFWGLAYQAIDDIKDVVHGVEQTGKTTSRDAALDRPNLFVARGPGAAVWTLQKLIRYGDSTAERVEGIDRSFRCLESARKRLAREAAKLVPELVGVSA